MQTNIFEVFLEIEELLKRLLVEVQAIRAAITPPPAARIVFQTMVNGILSEVTHMQIMDNQSLKVSITGQDVKGNPAPLDPAAAPVWALDDASFGTVVPAADGMSAVVSLSGKLGAFNVQVSIPAVNAEPALTGALPVTVVASAATQIQLSGVAQ